MDNKQLQEEQEVDLRARLKDLGPEWPKGTITHVGTVDDDGHTEQVVNLYRVHVGPEEEVGPYQVITATYIYNFWGDAAKRGELADVIVLNGVDGYKAVDPAEEMFSSNAE